MIKALLWIERVIVLRVYALHACSFNYKSDYNLILKGNHTRVNNWDSLKVGKKHDSLWSILFIIEYHQTGIRPQEKLFGCPPRTTPPAGSGRADFVLMGFFIKQHNHSSGA